MTQGRPSTEDVVALIPAAGTASRLGRLPCSKEIFPLGLRTDSQGTFRPKAVCEYLFERLTQAGIGRAYVILREGKWDVPAYLGHGGRVGVDLAYLLAKVPYGTPYTLDQAYPFVRGARVALGFPDIVFEPSNAFSQLLSVQAQYSADVVLGLFPAERPAKMDMVDVDGQGNVIEIVIKPPQTELKLTWIIAVWSPAFTEFMHWYVAENLESVRSGVFPDRGSPREPYVGDVMRAALREGLTFRSVPFDQGSCVDVGTPEDLERASRRLGSGQI